MAIALSAAPVVENRAPANPVAVKGNTVYTRQFKVVVPASTTAAGLVIGQVPPGTQVLGAVIDVSASYVATTLQLKTTDSTFVAAVVQTVVGGKQQTIAAGLGVICKTTNTDNLDLTLTTSAASPAVETEIVVTLTLVGLKDNKGYATQNT